jgi:predicted RecB family endonuclease
MAEVDLAQLVTRLTQLEERQKTPDPRISEALETAQRALQQSATAAERAEAAHKLKDALAALEARVPKAKQIGVDDPPEPVAEPPGPNPQPNPQPGLNPAPAPALRRRMSFW